MSFRRIGLTIFLSFFIHGLILVQEVELIPFKVSFFTKPQVLSIKSIRLRGKKDGLNQKLLTIPAPNMALEKSTIESKIKKPTLKNLSYKPLPLNPFAKKIFKTKLSSQKISMKKYLKSSAIKIPSARQVLDSLDSTDLQLKFDLPKGVKEDELNKRELVFYSFQKRAVTKYINAVIKEVNDYNRKYPSKNFPPTDHKEKLAGRLIYDKDGNVITIKTLAWSNDKTVQDLFMKVLKGMEKLHNPPREIIENEQFAINFALSLN